MTTTIDLLETMLTDLLYEEFEWIDIGEEKGSQLRNTYLHLVGELSTAQIGKIILSDQQLTNQMLELTKIMDPKTFASNGFEVSDEYEKIMKKRIAEADQELATELKAAYIYLNSKKVSEFENRCIEIVASSQSSQFNNAVDKVIEIFNNLDDNTSMKDVRPASKHALLELSEPNPSQSLSL